MNSKIRHYAKQHGVKLWQLAEQLNMHDYQLSKRLRHRLDENEIQHMIDLIDQIEAEGDKKYEDSE